MSRQMISQVRGTIGCFKPCWAVNHVGLCLPRFSHDHANKPRMDPMIGKPMLMMLPTIADMMGETMPTRHGNLMGKTIARVSSMPGMLLTTPLCELLGSGLNL